MNTATTPFQRRFSETNRPLRNLHAPAQAVQLQYNQDSEKKKTQRSESYRWGCNEVGFLLNRSCSRFTGQRTVDRENYTTARICAQICRNECFQEVESTALKRMTKKKKREFASGKLSHPSQCTVDVKLSTTSLRIRRIFFCGRTEHRKKSTTKGSRQTAPGILILLAVEPVVFILHEEAGRNRTKAVLLQNQSGVSELVASARCLPSPTFYQKVEENCSFSSNAREQMSNTVGRRESNEFQLPRRSGIGSQM